MRRQIVLFLVATQFLTRLPTPAWADYQANWLPQSARYFPLVGALVGGINVGVWWILGSWLPATVTVGLMLAVSLLVTGASTRTASRMPAMGSAAVRRRIGYLRS